MNPDLVPEPMPIGDAAAALAAVEQARADLADDGNLNAKLALERAFLRLGTNAA